MDHRNERALIVLGGDDVDPGEHRAIPDHSVVIAADSGIDQAHRLGLIVDVAIGDFDSVSAAGLRRAEQQGARVERHPADKDMTDFELALGAAVELGVASATVLGGEGGRLDHLVANALVMASPRYSDVDLTAVGGGGARLHVVRRTRRISGVADEYVTLLAVNGPAVGIVTTGLLYPLNGGRLDPGSSRGVSNQLTGVEATVSVESGVLLAILPGPSYRVAPAPDHHLKD